jgi:outer membrane protein assembly factor BamD (BamD/ComL family)
MATPNPAPNSTRARRALVLLAAVLSAAPGCHSARGFRERASADFKELFVSTYDDPRATEKFQAAQAHYDAGRYDEAQSQFRQIADNKGNAVDLCERARFMQAESRYQRGHYPEAVDTYHRLLLDFPTGALRRDACERIFKICDYWLDDFRAELDARTTKGETGVLRWKPGVPKPWDRTRPALDQEGRILEALERVHVHDIMGPNADKALFLSGYINFVRGNFNEADQFFSQLEATHKDSPLRPQAMLLAVQAKNNKTGGPSYDGRGCAEALHLVQVAQSSMPELTNNPDNAKKLDNALVAIRSQQAEKDMLMADYYVRTGHPGSAVFYYELVRRRYGGTRYSDIATERQARLLQLMKDGRPEVGNDPFAIAGAKFNEMIGRRPTGEEKDRARVDPNVAPAGAMQPPVTQNP